jgi:hypothetical protein
MKENRTYLRKYIFIDIQFAHRRVFNNEHNLYPKISVKIPC